MFASREEIGAMYKSFSVKNFRGFESLDLPALRQVNLLVGKNNVGKTALLEALFLHIGAQNPELPRRLSVYRGAEKLPAKEVWSALFAKGHADDAIELRSVDRLGEERRLTIRRAAADEVQTTFKEAPEKVTFALTTESVALSGFAWVYSDSSGHQATSRILLGPDQQFLLQKSPLPAQTVGAFIPSGGYSSQDAAERFTELERRNRQSELIEPLRVLEPRLQRLAVGVAGGEAMIYGDVQVGELLPITLLGDGTRRLLTILLTILSTPRGYVLVDEVENGLHYSVMEKVWEAVGQAAKSAMVQIFATTHSWECVEAAHRAFNAEPDYEFCLYRLDRIDRQVRAVGYDKRKLTAAALSDLEVR
jgi:predicted ATPase